MTAVDDAATTALDIPPGPRSRVARFHSIDGDAQTAAALAARVLLTDSRGVPDGLAIALVRTAGTRSLAAWAAKTLGVPEIETTEAIESTASALAGTARLSVAEALTLRCHRSGIRKAYAYPGTSELALCHAFAALADGVVVNSRGDAEAVFMAGGASLAGRRPAAVAIVHGARGLTNAAGAVGDLRRNEVPALVVVGLPSTRSAQFLPPHGEDRLLEIVGGLAKAATQLAWAGRAAGPVPVPDVVDALDEALATASALPAGPVLLGVPQDIVEARVVPADDLAQPPRPPAVAVSDARALRRARALLSRTRSPVILIDDHLLAHAGATPALAALAGHVQAPVFQVRYRRGPMLFGQLTSADCPQSSGPYDPGRNDHRETMARADLLITIEDRNVYRRVVGELPGCPKLTITSDPAKTRRNGYLRARDVLIAGDPIHIIDALLHDTIAAAAPAPDRRPAVAPAAARIRGGGEARGPGEPGEWLRNTLAGVVRGCLTITGARHVVDDSQMAGGVLAAVYEHTFGEAKVSGDHGGFVGAGIPTATGLSITHGVDVLCLLGDQGFTNGSQGLVAAAQEGAAVLFVVCNNGESVSLRNQSAVSCPAPAPGDFDRLLRNPPGFSYVAAASAAGIPAACVNRSPDSTGPRPGPDPVAEILETVEDLWNQGRPALVELRLPGHGPAWDGIWATRGFDERPDHPRHRRWHRPLHRPGRLAGSPRP